jgi:lipopolysaccharide/colanic/teichoic acid biosynthesis glycosyltransferase
MKFGASIDATDTIPIGIMRRAVDVVGSVLFLIFQLPTFLVIAAVIRLTSKAPVFVGDTRVGLGGRKFKMWKFGGIGRVRTFLERTSLDLLPQFANVLLGDLTFIGPRPFTPELDEFVPKIMPQWIERRRMKPGLMGLSDSGLTIDFEVRRITTGGDVLKEHLTRDLYYIKQRSLRLDALIVLHSVKRLFFRE